MPRRSCWIFSLTLLLASLASCGADDNTYRSLRLAIYIDNSTHQDATLATAMNAASPGVFCRVSYEASSRSFVFASNQGQQSKSRLNAKETEMGFYGRIGMNNGIIVGYGNLSTGASGAYTFYAYDAQCPNCFDYNAIPVKSYPLTMNTAGIATCAKCKRQYNMNTGGNCVNDSGKGLTTYRSSTTGALGYLVVN